jgi:hypothetical protein
MPRAESLPIVSGTAVVDSQGGIRDLSRRSLDPIMSIRHQALREFLAGVPWLRNRRTPTKPPARPGPVPSDARRPRA